MKTPDKRRDGESAAAWLRRHAWGERGKAGGPPSAPERADEACGAADGPPAPQAALPEDEEIDIAGWPALVAPFYD